MPYGTQQTAWDLLVHVIANGITNAGAINDTYALKQIVDDFLRDLQQQNIITGYSAHLNTKPELNITVTFPGDRATYTEVFALPTQNIPPPTNMQVGGPPPTQPGSNNPKPSNPKDDAYDRAMRGI